MAFSPNAETVYADGPFGSPLQPAKSEIRALLAQYEAIMNAFTANGGLIYSTLAFLEANLNYPRNTMAWVVADAVVANNGIYRKLLDSGTGSWTRMADLPFSFIIASDVGAGTPNAIQATTSIPVSSSALVWMNIFEANTASPVTVSFNGGSALTIKTNSGNDVSAGGLTAGMIVMGIVSGSTFRLVSDQASAGIVAAAEAAADRAEAAAAYVTGIDTVTAAESGSFPNSVRFLQLLGRNAYGDGGAFKAVEVTEDGSPLAPGQFQTNVNLKRWENAEDVITPAMFSDIVEMFAFTKAQMRIPKANYEFDGWITIRNNAVIRCEEGAMFLPTFEPVGTDRNTPLIDLGTGCDINYLKTHLVAGIDTIRTMVKAGGACRIGRYIATSVNLNNNRAAGAADAIDAGALLIRGTGNAIGLVEVDMHDSVINIDNAFRTTIDRVIETNFVTGIAGRDSSIVDIGSVYASAVDPAISLAMSTPRGNMTPGANAIVWGGVERVSVGDVEAYNVLEHTIRLGAKQPSGTITNQRHSYGNIKTFAPYGCGFKMDDADAFTIKRVQIKTLYTEDVGHDVWGQPNDGNKAGCAVRNAEFVQIGLYMNRAVNYANSGNDGLWVEKSKNVQIAGADVQNARGYGVLVNPNGSDIDHVTITGIRSAFNGKSGVGVIPASNNNIRGVYLQGVSSNNTEYGVEVAARTDGSSPFVTEPTSINITVRNNALGGKSVPDAVALDGDFFDGVVERSGAFRSVGAPSLLTISGGVVQITRSYHLIDTEDAAATDDLDTINGGVEGDILVLRPNSSSRDVTVKHATGNIRIGSDFTFTNAADTLTLIYVAGLWVLYGNKADNVV